MLHPTRLSLSTSGATPQAAPVNRELVERYTSQVWSGACVRADHQGLEKRHARKQPANLVVEAAEESLTTLPDYKPTVRPPPKRC
jgi:hypothetical protein